MSANEINASPRRHVLPMLQAIAAAAILVGLYARFKGLGVWPLAADEYYIARSVENLLRSGWPEYLCGGFYTRGLLFQYVSALLQLGGLSAELAPRLIAALSSLAAFPAVYILGKRTHSSAVGLLALALLALSIWEVEMSRFGRMYAPFQTIFAWYLVFFLKFTVDGRRAALLPMILLTILGAVTWEGAVFLALANFLPPLLNNRTGRLAARDWVYLAGVAALALPVYWFATNELRFASVVPPFPDDYDSVAGEFVSGPGSVTLTQALLLHPLWTAMTVVPIGAALNSLRWVASFRNRWIAALALLVALGAALLHQFLAVAAVVLLLMMLRLLNRRELFSRVALPFHAFLSLSVLFWTAFGLLNGEWQSSQEFTWLHDNRLVALAYEFIRFPDFLVEVVWPWVGAASIFSLALVTLLAIGIAHSIARDGNELSAEQVLQVVFVCLILAASASGPPRHETRYVYFLFPIALILALTTVARTIEAHQKYRAWSTTLTAAVVLGGFLLMEDFQPKRLWSIDSAATNFRLDESAKRRSHFHPRNDTRGAGNWLTEHASGTDSLVINDFPGVDFYFSGFDFTFIDRERDQRFDSYACNRGTAERWSNLPLVYTFDALESRVAAAQRVYMVTSGGGLDATLQRLARSQPQVVWRSIDGGVAILEFKAQ